MKIQADTTTNLLAGFGNIHYSEAIPNTLPQQQNSPQQTKFNLYPEQISGSAFTSPRAHNLKSWLYKIAPSVVHDEFLTYNHQHIYPEAYSDCVTPPTQQRWLPLPMPTTPTTFVNGLIPWAFNGNPNSHTGAAIYLYTCNTNMSDEFFSNADGELLIVPEQGGLRLATEFGVLEINPNEIAVIPRGVKFSVALLTAEQTTTVTARGYVLENYGAPFILPELGPIGANGLANPRHFLYPTAAFNKQTGKFNLINKFQNRLWQAHTNVHPLNVVAWYGNYAPYKYNLNLFNTINTVSFDHPDPSIFTVLTSQTSRHGTANIDFVIFPPRWMVAENTFRPPYYHRNVMSEFMGLINGKYDAKSADFMPGGCSLHNTMTAHGPGRAEYLAAINKENLTPDRYQHTLAFMFESNLPWNLTKAALTANNKDAEYLKEWQNLPLALV
jgi:homogentisate 1,2-dioxygenase